jgi:antitoxin YefM
MTTPAMRKRATTTRKTRSQPEFRVVHTRVSPRIRRLWDRVVGEGQPTILKRSGARDLALIDAAELRGLFESIYLLRSPRNAEIILNGLARAKRQEDQPRTVESVCQEMGFAAEA